MIKRFVTAAGVAFTMLVAGCTSSGTEAESSTATTAPSFTTVDVTTVDTTTVDNAAVDTTTAATTIVNPSSSAPGSPAESAENTAEDSTSAAQPTTPGQAGSTGGGELTSAGEATAPVGPAVYTPPVDAQAVPGDCPYLTVTEVAQDTGQRTGAASIRPGTPFPVCEFVRTDGGYLATVRVLQFATDVEATAAVDYYLPRDTSEPATKPDGWSGGLMVVGADESRYGVSKGTTAVIGVTNLDTTVSARELVKHTIANLGF